MSVCKPCKIRTKIDKTITASLSESLRFPLPFPTTMRFINSPLGNTLDANCTTTGMAMMQFRNVPIVVCEFARSINGSAQINPMEMSMMINHIVSFHVHTVSLWLETEEACICALRGQNL